MMRYNEYSDDDDDKVIIMKQIEERNHCGGDLSRRHPTYSL